MPQGENNNWMEWSKHVLKELERLNDVTNRLGEEISTLKVEVGKLQVKSGAWGALAGFITVLIALAFQYLKSSGG